MCFTTRKPSQGLRVHLSPAWSPSAIATAVSPRPCHHSNVPLFYCRSGRCCRAPPPPPPRCLGCWTLRRPWLGHAVLSQDEPEILLALVQQVL